jgi:MFS family permease
LKPIRRPGSIQACILLASAGLSSLATAVLGPSLPKMQEYFRFAPNAEYLVPFSLTAPMLVMACLSVFVGLAADKFGRKRILLAATAFYAVCGTAPLWLDSLRGVLASRVLLGVAEACLMTVSTTMIGDYFTGARRVKLMSLHTTVAAVSAFLLNIAGGLLGEHGWRAPYMVYAISLPLAALMPRYLWEPGPGREPQRTAVVAEDVGPLNVHRLLGICALTVGVGLAFMTVPVHLGYLFTELGINSSARIGLAYALNSVGVIVGTLAFGWVLAHRVPRVVVQLGLAAAVLGLSFVAMSMATTYLGLTLAAMANGIGAGLILPAVVSWNMRELPFSHRGIGVGAFQSSLFLGMSLNPLCIVYLAKSQGSRGAAVALVGEMLLFAALIAAIVAAKLRVSPQRLDGKPLV